MRREGVGAGGVASVTIGYHGIVTLPDTAARPVRIYTVHREDRVVTCKPVGQK